MAAVEGRLKTIAALLSAGPADAVDEVWLDPLRMKSICTEIYFTFMLERVCTYIARQPLATHARVKQLDMTQFRLNIVLLHVVHLYEHMLPNPVPEQGSEFNI